MNRRSTIVLGTTLALTLTAGPAFAHNCVNASKQGGAGSAAELYFTAYISPEGDIVGFDEEFTGEPNPQGRATGGWLTAHFIAAVDGQAPVEIASFDVLLHQDLRDTPRFGGPGATSCDGVGIDDLESCLNPLIADFLGSL